MPKLWGMRRMIDMNLNWSYGILDDVVSKGSSNISLNKIKNDDGEFPVYGAKGFIQNVSFYQQEKPYLAIIKDGAGIGRVSKHPEKSSVLATMQYIVPQQGYDLDFVKYFLHHIDFEKYRTGSTIPHVYYKDYKVEPFPLIALEEQKQIVEVLDKAFAAIDQAKANIEKNLQNAKELFQSKLNEIFTQKGEGWEEKKLGDSSLLSIIDGDRGKNYPKKSDFFPEGHCVFMNTGNVRPNGFDFSTVMFITEERDSLLRKGKLQRNDVVMTTRGTIGNLGWFNDAVKHENIRINSGMLIFRVNKQRILPEYLFTVLRSPVVTKQIAEMTSGAAQPQLPIKTLVHFDIPFHPDLVKQRNMIGKIQELESMTDDLVQIGAKKLRKLDEFKKSILQKAFAGQLDIK